ncbi:hypothetical protein [Lacrimispora sp.]|uniref:hypothetical protein n=1 Tax=Lacrimispora sp. TaxID=2719234 RepID=UPI0028545A46|nr:hypothetical protein [Lacrimispora sp.]MDR7814620.1 hypothetical protein [Lacrimispora sp.]
MSKCKIYVVYDGDKKIGSYTAAEAEEELGIPKKQVAIYEKNEWKYQGRYSFLPQEEPQKGEPGEKKYISNALALDWDFTTKMLLAVGGRKTHGKG